MKKIILIIIVIVAIGGFFVCYFLEQRSKAPSSEITPTPKESLIKVDNPQPNQEIQSPFIVKGKARGNWYFEAVFPVKLLDENGNVIVQTQARALNDWMTEDFVPFEAVLTFSVPEDQNGTLVLQKDNPSGLPKNDAEIRIPVALKATGQLRTVKLYYYNSNLDKDSSGNVMCSRQGLVAVERAIPITNTPIQDAIKLLISGNITEEEKAQGITTEYPLQGFSLVAASLNNDVLTLTFDDPDSKTSGGSCRAGILWFQIEATAKQFSGIQQVHFEPEYIFQP